MSSTNRGPRHKGLKREVRLKVGKQWMQTYQGNNIIKGYRKYFGTSALCAALELQMLGCDIPEDQIQKIREDEYKRHQMEQERKRKKTMLQIPLTNEQDPWSNENYAFIAGYTSAGFPYGVTWEEAQLVTPVPDTNL